MDTETSAIVQRHVIGLRIIVFSLVLGLLIFMGIAYFLVEQGMITSIGTDVICYLAAALLFITFTIQFAMTSMLDKQARQQLDRRQLRPWLAQYQARTIIGASMLEGPGFLGVIGYMLEHNVVGLAVGGLVALLMLAMYFPSEDRVMRHVERQRELAEQEAMNSEPAV
jgi:hypothetical protein